MVEVGGVETGCRAAGARRSNSSGATLAGQVTQAHHTRQATLHQASLVATNSLVTLAMGGMTTDDPALGVEGAGEGGGVVGGSSVVSHWTFCIVLHYYYL